MNTIGFEQQKEAYAELLHAKNGWTSEESARKSRPLIVTGVYTTTFVREMKGAHNVFSWPRI